MLTPTSTTAVMPPAGEARPKIGLTAQTGARAAPGDLGCSKSHGKAMDKAVMPAKLPPRRAGGPSIWGMSVKTNSMPITTIEAVVPVRLSGAKDRLTGQRLQLLLQTLSARWSDAAPLRLTIVGMSNELPRLREITDARFNLDIRVLDERELIDDPRLLALNGWFKQMFIKLLFARVCEADAYLYLDADIVCVRPLSRSDLLHDGRAVTGWEPKQAHPGWWKGARRVLGRPFSDREWGLGVTPNVLVRDIAAAIPDAVRRATGAEPVDALLAASGDTSTCWVEHTLYCELAEMTGDLDRLHTPITHPSPFHSAADLWTRAQLANWNPLAELAAAPHVRFVVAQSNTGVDPAIVRQRLGPVVAACSVTTPQFGAEVSGSLAADQLSLPAAVSPNLRSKLVRWASNVARPSFRGRWIGRS